MPEPQGQLTIHTDEGDADELFGLLEWLNDDDELRGRVRRPSTPIRPGEMGGVADVLVVTLGAGGVASVLAQSLTAWFTHRRSDITLTLTAGETELAIDAKRVETPEVAQALQALLEQANKSQ
ncbi:effector-associated constant component EACC1 [Nocardia africana]